MLHLVSGVVVVVVDSDSDQCHTYPLFYVAHNTRSFMQCDNY